MRWVQVTLCVGALAITQLVAVAGEPTASTFGSRALRVDRAEANRLDWLEQWLKLVARHAPGQKDPALEEIAAWPNSRLKQLWIDANVLIQITRRESVPAMNGNVASRFGVRAEGQKTATPIQYSRAELHRLAVLACAAGGTILDSPCMATNASSELDADLRQIGTLSRASRLRGDDNYILRHGALLHADVGMLAPASMAAPGDARPTGLDRVRMEISDGRELDVQQSAVHWEIARMLLDFVRPRGHDRADPAHDDMVRQWYTATAAWMQLHEDHDRRHLDRALMLFPSDPDILFLSASQRETYAGPAIQSAVRSAILPTGVTMDVGSARVELREAEGLFRRVLELKRGYGEARLRYGHVLGALGKHAEAAAELRRALGDIADPPLLYLASLFLGGEEEALGNRDAARVAYGQAATLFPRAQSPLLALSELAHRNGDRAGALKAIDRLFDLPEDDREAADDPWWSYYVMQARDADERLDAVWAPYLSERLE